MSEYNPGFFRIYTPLRPFSLDSFAAILRDKDMSGGYRVVQTLEERDNIPEFNEVLEEALPDSNYRKAGMLCYVVETNITYRLTGELTNEEWIEEHHNLGLTFQTEALMNDYLQNPNRYAGQIASCQEKEGKLFVLSNSRDSWLLASSNEEHHDKHLVFIINYKTEEIIEHNLGKKPAVQIFTSDGELCIADIQHIDINTTKINFNNTFSGKVTFN